jgi:hypothetical protein
MMKVSKCLFCKGVFVACCMYMIVYMYLIDFIDGRYLASLLYYL